MRAAFGIGEAPIEEATAVRMMIKTLPTVISFP